MSSAPRPWARALVSTTPRALATLWAGLLVAGGLAWGVFKGRSCLKASAPAHEANVVALVNGEALTRQSFEAELRRDTRSPEGQAPSPEQVAQVKRALLESQVDRTLLLQEARARGVQVSAEEVDRRMLRMGGDYPADGFEAALVQGELGLSELKARTAELLTLEKLFSEHVYPRVAVTEAELHAHFEAHAARFRRPEAVRAAQIVVKTLEEARKVQALLRSGQKFSELARRYSLSADAKVGGDLGFFERGVMPEAFDQAAFRLAVGEVSEVVESEYGFHLFKVLARRSPEQPSFTEVRATLEAELLREARTKAEGELLAQLRAKAKLWVNEATLAQVTDAKGQ